MDADTTETEQLDGSPSQPSRSRRRIALVGCGAISELYHLPALQANNALDEIILVDANLERAGELAAVFGVAETAADYRAVAQDVDGAIVATPPNSHREICVEFLSRGKPVLCEKPLAPTAADALAMVEAAASSGTTLCVNHTRRLYPTNLKVRELIEDGTLGELQSIEYVDGDVFNWPTASGFYFEPGARGVLSDRGIHSLDLICWWLDAKPDLVSAQTDSFGGPESLAMIRLQHAGCRIDLKLSWLTALPNTFRVVGDRATVDGRIGEWRALTLTPNSASSTKIKIAADEVSYNDFGVTMIANFLDVLTKGSDPMVPGASVVAATQLVDESYGRAERMTLPWLFDGRAS